MSTVTVSASMPPYEWWADFFQPSNSTVSLANATTYNYVRADGTRVSITGTGLQYDPSDPDVPIGGTITSLVVSNAASQPLLTITGLSLDAMQYYYAVNGYTGDQGQDGNGFEAISLLLLRNDTINGSDNGDDIPAGRNMGNDIIHANGGDDWVKGDQGNDTIDGGTGYDSLTYDETVYPDRGAFRGIVLNASTGIVTDSWGYTDHISNFEEYYGSIFADSMTGSAADDGFAGLRGADTINGGAGFDWVIYGRDDRTGGHHGINANLTTHVIIDGWGSRDTVTNVEEVDGTRYNDTFVGSAADEWFMGLAGIDSYNGGAGYDTISFGGISNAGAVHGVTVNLGLATGQVVNDGFNNVETLVSIESVNGSRLNDVITGNAAADLLRGREGNDILNGAAGADTLRGGIGNDRYVVDNAGDIVDETADGGNGVDTVQSAVRALNLSDAVHFVGAVENATLTGAANLSLTGNALANVLTGNAGSNILSGLAGNDRLTGGAGSDFFLFNTALNAAANVDTITDFSVPADTIRLENAVFTGLPTAGPLAATAFHVGPTANAAAQRVLYNNANGWLSYDADGNGAGAAVHFATLTVGLGLTSADFVVV